MKRTTLILILAFFTFNGFSVNPITANEVIQLIKDQVNCSWAKKTVDTFKCGNPDDKVTGIISCMFPDMYVLREAVEKNCNLIIAHEPTFYGHMDEVENFKGDPVYEEKIAYINEHRLIIWRFHDHWHRHSPDGIYQGMLEHLGWTGQRIDDRWNYVEVKKQSLSDLVGFLANKLNAKGIRVIGNPDLVVDKASLALGAPGSDLHYREFRNDDSQVIIAGESREWESYQYVNDAVAEGKQKAIIFLGHIPSEEVGMEFFARWLKEKGVKQPIYFVKNKSPYWIYN